MAKMKKAATKKKKKKKKKAATRRELWFEQKAKKRKQPDAKILKQLGVRTCWLCHKHLNGIAEFEKHLSEDHETTLREYDKMYPGQSFFIPFDKRVTGDQIYRAYMYRMTNGCWPDWFDGNQKIEIDSADPSLLRAAANMLLTYQMHRIGPIMEASAVASRRMFELADASELNYDDLWDFMGHANDHIKDATNAIRILAEVVEKATPKPPKGDGGTVRMGFVAAGTIESGDSTDTEARRKVEQRRHHLTASVSEFTQAMQGFLSGGPENGPDIPSKVEREVEVEQVDVKARGRQAGSGEEEKSPPAGTDGSHKR